MIIHFTNNFNIIKSILTSHSFKLRYCGEYFSDKEGKIISNSAHPMVSFSDYDDSELNKKRITYGKYGVALSKKWAIANGLSPVNYVEKNSPVAEGLVSLLKARQKNTIPDSLRLPIIQLKCFTKHVYGFNSYFDDPNFNFKSENEWRFVPSLKQIDKNRISENFSTYKKNKDKYNTRLEKDPLRFTNDDVVFIYVTSEIERNEVIRMTSLPSSQVKISTWEYKPYKKTF